MNEEPSKVANWRKLHQTEGETCEALEAVAFRLRVHDLCEIRRGWTPPTLDDTEHSDSLEEFSARVRRMTEVLGRPPDSCAATGSGWGQWADGQAPDLVARWSIEESIEHWDRVVIQVRVMTPRGCKVDPRTAFVEAQNQELHPECKAVLSDLEEGR